MSEERYTLKQYAVRQGGHEQDKGPEFINHWAKQECLEHVI